jgi:LysR family glycine cleavage system transcriptional activator
MARKLPSLYALHVFEAAARHQHFRRAAGELALSQGAVSYQIKVLEAELGFALFERRGRAVVLTREGSLLSPILQESFGEIADMVDLLRQQTRTGIREVTIGATTYFSSRWLLRRLSRFMGLNPEISIRIAYPPATGQIIPTTAIEIRWGEGHWPGAHSIKLFDAELTPVCAPTLAGESRTIGVENLSAYRFLHDGETQEAWQRWQRAAGVKKPMRLAGPIIADPNLRFQAAVDGQGIALADRLLVDEIKSGQLIAPFAVSLGGYGYHLIFNNNHKPSVAEQNFAEWILDEARHPFDP